MLGRLTRDVDLRHTNSGTAVARFTLAVSRGYSKAKEQEVQSQGGQTADFINIVCFNKTAELVANYLAKGRQVAVQGRIQTSSYEGQDGNRIYRTDVVADRVEFIGGQGNSQSSNDNFGLGDDAFPIDDSDIPF